MKAAVIDTLGTALRVTAHPDPSPATGDQVLVKVEATALNVTDLHIASGRHRAGPPRLPYVPGLETVGTIAAGSEQGLRVRALAPAGLVPGVNGGLAELLLTDRAACVPVPEGLDSATAAAIGVVGTSADLSLRKAGIQAGDSVLVLGATGPLGTAVIQLARLAGAKRVITAGRNPERLAQLAPRRGRCGATRRGAAARAAGFPRRSRGPGRGPGVGPLGRTGPGMPQTGRPLPERRRGRRRRDQLPRRMAPRRAADAHRLQRDTRGAGRPPRQLPAHRGPRRTIRVAASSMHSIASRKPRQS